MSPSKREQDPFRVAPRDSVHEWLDQVLSFVPELSVRRFFGGAGVYSEDTMFGILHERRLYLKTDERTRARYVELGSEALRARAGTVPTSYYEVPAEVLDDEEELARFARLALEVARQAPERPQKRARVEPEQILEGHRDEIRELAERAAALVRAAAPEASEAGYPGWRLIGYRGPHYFCFVSPQPDHVRVGFEHGHALPDPQRVLEPMGKLVRFVRLVPGKRVPVAALRSLIQAALAYRPPPRGKKKRSKARARRPA